MRIRKGVKLLEEDPGDGAEVELHGHYVMAVRLTLSRGEVIKSPENCLGHSINDRMTVEESGYFQHQVRIDRENLIPGLFYAVQGMKIGGYRKVNIAPHLAYGEKGVPNIIPPHAMLTAEIRVLERIGRGVDPFPTD